MLRSIRGGGPGRPARRVQAGLGEGHEPACHLRLPRVCLHLAHPSMYGTTCPYLPFGCQPSRQCVVSMRRTSRPFLMYTAPPARRGRRIHTVRELWQGNRPARTKMPLRWQDVANMRSRALADGKMLAKCVPGRQSVASFALYASQKRSRTGKSPVRGKIRAPCIRNELALAGYARHASEKPCKQPFGNTPREDLARKGRFSLRGLLESCMRRESCHSWAFRLGVAGEARGEVVRGVPAQRMRLALCEAARRFRGFISCSFELSPLTRTMLLLLRLPSRETCPLPTPPRVRRVRSAAPYAR